MTDREQHAAPPGATLHLGGLAYAAAELEPLLRPIAETKPYPGNPRRHGQDGITASIRDHGLYQGIVVQAATGHTIVGNGRRQALLDLGAERVPVTVLDVPDDRAAAIVARDNRTSDLAWNDPQDLLDLLATFDGDTELLSLAGYDDPEELALLERQLHGDEPGGGIGDDRYTRKTNPIHYEPTEATAPPVSELLDRSKTAELMDAISAADVPEDVRAFLVAGAQRHLVFDYARIAEFYAHADPHVQRLMEASALVIVDFDDAIHHGFVRLSSQLEALLAADLETRADLDAGTDPGLDDA